jgi:HD superfamily phosphohydrolase
MSGETRVDQVAELQRQLQDDPALRQALNAAFDRIGFTEKVARDGRAVSKRKAIKDNVWGMLDFSAHEMRLIDSPLLQRMRGIHQLGLSYLTYPSAEHTRFIHSLGMAHVVSRFIAGIDRNRSDDLGSHGGSPKYERFESLLPLHQRELLYSALLHDVGHMPFSHASETPLAANASLFTLGGMSIEDRLTRIHIAVSKDISLSEALSIVVVLSERFETFYKLLDDELARDPQSIPRIACLIAGVPTVGGCPNIQDIISAAAVDADKIDYVNRDAKACGISVGVDVSRIFLGGGLVKASRSTYDDTYEGDDKSTLFVVNSSGADTLDEIVQARSSLYQRVYLHPLTRTAEALLARALLANAQLEVNRNVELSDALSLWSMSDAELLGRVATHANEEIAELGQDLRMRRLPKKACAFAGSLVTLQSPLQSQLRGVSKEVENTIRKDVGNSFLEVLTRERIGEIGTTYLEDEIRREANLLAERLQQGSGRKLVPRSPLSIVVVTWIAIMGSTRPDALVFQNGEIVRTPALTNVQGQQDAYDIFKAVGYVLCDPDWRQIVFQAARFVLYRESLCRNPDAVERKLQPHSPATRFRQHTLLDFDGSARRANLRLTEAHDLAYAAESAGYYDEVPLLARRLAADDADVRGVVKRFETFDGEQGWRIRGATVAAFADQFPPALRQPLLRQLAQGTYLNQAAIAGHLHTALSEASVAGFSNSILVPLSASSGGAVAAMLAASLPQTMTSSPDLAHALAESDDRPILFVDDNAASGVQSAAQLFNFSSMPRSEWPKDLAKERDLFDALPPECWEKFAGRQLGVVTAVGTDKAAGRLKDAAHVLGLEGFAKLFYGQRLGAGVMWSADLAAFLQKVGKDLMAQRLFGRPYADLEDQERPRCDEHCFGYGNHGGVTVTNVNVPSSTVTALWQPGAHNGRPWIPLFLRRGRFRDLLLA